MECNAFIYTTNVNDFINIADGKKYGYYFRYYELMRDSNGESYFKCRLRLPDSRYFPKSVFDTSSTIKLDLYDLFDRFRKFSKVENENLQKELRKQLNLEDSNLKKFQLTISAGYLKVSNATIEVSAQKEDEAEEIAYEMIAQNKGDIDWVICPIDDDINYQTEEITQLN